MSSRNKKKNKLIKETYFEIIPLMLIGAFVPLIFAPKFLLITGMQKKLWPSKEFHIDLFSYYKQSFIILLAVAAILMLIIKMLSTNDKLTKPTKGKFCKFSYSYYPMGVLAIMILLSAFAAEDKTTAFLGFMDRYEGFYVLISYIIITICAFNLIRSEKHIRIMLWGIITSAVVISVIGILQYCGANPFKLEIFQNYIKAILNMPNFKYNFNDTPFMLYSTLFNSNYVGSYTALLMSVVFAIFIYVKRPIHKLIIGVTTCIIFATAVGSQSRGGIIGVIISLVILVIIMRVNLLRNKNIIYVVVAIACFFGLTVGMNVISGGRMMQHFSYNNSDILSNNSDILCNNSNANDAALREKGNSITTMEGNTNNNRALYQKDLKFSSGLLQANFGRTLLQSNLAQLASLNANMLDNIKLRNIETDKNTYPFEIEDVIMDKNFINIIAENYTLSVVLKDNVVVFKDGDNKELEVITKDKEITFKDQTFRDFKITQSEDKVATSILFKSRQLLQFLVTAEGFNILENPWMPMRKGNEEIQVFQPLKGLEKVGSNRGYIWSRSIQMLKETIFLGHGPDTFALYFPQYDFVGKLRYYDKASILVDKPHNMYLQTALNTGVLSLIAFLVILGMYFITCGKVYFRAQYTTFTEAAGAACFAGVVGYCIAGFFNDSVVSVAPVFWVLLGMGMSINYMLRLGDKKIKR